MYTLFYELKNAYGDKLKLVYTDTDSFLLQFDDVVFMDEIKNGYIAKMMDLSNLSGNECDVRYKGVLGKLKSETGSMRIIVFFGAQPKNYSLKMGNKCGDVDHKTACKGINRCAIPLHEEYERLFNECENGNNTRTMATVTNIQSTQCTLYTTRTVKSAIMYMDKKRYKTSLNESLGYGHPDIKQNVTNQLDDDNTIIQPNRNKREREEDELVDVDSTLCVNQRKLTFYLLNI